MFIQIGKHGFLAEALRNMTEAEAVEMFGHIAKVIVKTAWKMANDKNKRQAKN